MTETDPALRFRPLWLAVGWALVATIVWFSLTPSPPEPFKFHFADKAEHFAAYFALMSWFAQVYFRRAVRRRYAVAFLALGVAIEFLQGLEPTRDFELADMLADALGIGAALMLGCTPLRHTLQALESLIPGAESRTDIR